MKKEFVTQTNFSHTFRRVFLCFSVAIVVGIFGAQFVRSAEPPTIITYQAKLLQSSASVTTTKAMSFQLFDASSGGNLLYTAAGTLSATSTINVTPDNGVCTVSLGGSGTNALDGSIFKNNNAVYLEVWVGSTALTPRKRITSAPFALNSEYLMGVSATTTSSSTYIPMSNSFGNFTFTGTPQSSGVSGGVIYVNPTSTTLDYTLLGVADNGSERFRVDKEGDAWLFGGLSVTGTLNVVATTTLATTTITSSTIGTLNVSGQSTFSGTSTFNGFVNVSGKVGNPVHKSKLANAGGPSSNLPTGIAILGNYAYVTGYAGNDLEIVDISNPASATRKGGLVDNNNLNGPGPVAVSGNYAYVVSGFSHLLEIIDVSDPANPVHKGSLANGVGGASLYTTNDVVVSGKYAYVIDGTNGGSALEIVDISNPANPVHKGKLDANVNGAQLFGGQTLVVSGNYAYVGAGTNGGTGALEIVDISNPSRPAHKGTLLDGTGGAVLKDIRSIYVSGNYAYIASGFTGNTLEIVDISNPASPTHKGKISNGGSTLLNFPMSVYVSGNYAYVVSANSSALEVVDVSDPSNPTHKSSLTNGTGGASLSSPRELVVAGNYAYITDLTGSSLEVVDISGGTFSQVEIGTTKTNNLQVLSNADFDQTVTVRGGLNVGTSGLLLNGELGFSTPTTSVSATNTLSFSHTALFKSIASSTSSNLFIFDTNSSFTTTTQYLLSVRQSGNSLFSIAGNGDVRASGTLFAQSATVGTPGAPGDLAERVDISGDDVEPGDVIIVDNTATDSYRRSTTAYDPRVAGVVSTHPTIVVGDAKTSRTAMLALTGRVPIKVSDENGPIERGDLLVTASMPGYAMKYNPLKDDGIKVVGVIGMALEPLTSGTGKIMGLVRTGWVNNRNQTINTLQKDVVTIAAAAQVQVQSAPMDLTAAQNNSGQIVVSGNENLDMHNFMIINVASIVGSNNKWAIDNEGRFVTKVQTSHGTKSLYALQSDATQFIISGSDTLVSGEKRIDYSDDVHDIIDTTKPIKISVTLTGPAGGVYISEKDERGFKVKEVNNGVSGATFDWVVIAERRVGDFVTLDSSNNNSTSVASSTVSDNPPSSSGTTVGAANNSATTTVSVSTSTIGNATTSSTPTISSENTVLSTSVAPASALIVPVVSPQTTSDTSSPAAPETVPTSTSTP